MPSKSLIPFLLPLGDVGTGLAVRVHRERSPIPPDQSRGNL